MKIAFYPMKNTRTIKQNIAPQAIYDLMQREDVEVIDERPGVLLDNYLLYIGSNYAIVTETALNCWSSAFRMKYGNPDKMQPLWDSFCEEYDREAAEEEERYRQYMENQEP